MTDKAPTGLDLGFDKRWERHPAPQATTEPVFWLKTGWKPSDLAGKRVLDVGCGCGRFVQIAASHGAEVVGLDISPHALAASRRNVPMGTFVEHDLTQPFPESIGTFDLVYSLGVLHHTSDPARSFANAAKVVRPGGDFVVWLYAQPVPSFLIPAEQFLHEITKACPPEALHAACQKWAVELRDLYKRRPDTAWLQTILRVSGSADDEECISDTFDWMTPQYRFWHTVPEVIGWFEAVGFTPYWIGDFPTTVKGRRNA